MKKWSKRFAARGSSGFWGCLMRLTHFLPLQWLSERWFFEDTSCDPLMFFLCHGSLKVSERSFLRMRHAIHSFSSFAMALWKVFFWGCLVRFTHFLPLPWLSERRLFEDASCDSLVSFLPLPWLSERWFLRMPAAILLCVFGVLGCLQTYCDLLWIVLGCLQRFGFWELR